jgi:PKD repeat protein
LDGTIASYLWDFGDGTTSTDQNPQHTYTVLVKYVATLTVTDNLAIKTSDTVAIEATAPNQPPDAKFVVTSPTGRAPLNVVLTSDESYDSDGAIGNVTGLLVMAATIGAKPPFTRFRAQASFA